MIWPAVLGLVGVLVGAVIALLSGWQSRRWAHQQWLLDRRHESYARLLASIREAIELRSGATHPQRADAYTAIFGAAVDCEMVASDPVVEAVTELLVSVNAWSKAGDREAAEKLGDHGATLNALMRADLAHPPSLRSKSRP